MFMIMKADSNRFQHIQENLRSGVILGRDEYPKTMTAAFELLQKTCQEVPTPNPGRGWLFRKAHSKLNNFVSHSPSFAQVYSEVTPGKDGRTYPNIVCHHCHKRGHYLNQCPTAPTEKKPKPQFCQYIMNQTVESGINKNWILLDTASTVSVSNNPALVHDIQPCRDDVLTIVTGGGTHTFDQKEVFNLLHIAAHFDLSSLANIISMKDVASLPGARVTMDSTINRAIVLHYNGTQFVFQECADGLYFLDASQANRNHSNHSVNHYSRNNFQLVTTVKDNLQHFTKREIKGAQAAWELQGELGWPSTEEFLTIISDNTLKNSTVTVADIHRAIDIYGPPVPLLQGKTTQKKPLLHKPQHLPLPFNIIQKHPRIDLYVDIFFVNRIPFLHTKSQHIGFITSQRLSSRGQTHIIAHLKHIINKYNKRGFAINFIHADNEFNLQRLKSEIQPVCLEIYAPEEHVTDIERSVRTVKERCRCMTHSVPYTRYTHLMTTHLVEAATHWLNAFPKKIGIIAKISPSAIVTGQSPPDYNNKRIAFGAYAIVFVKTQNNQKARSVPAIALSPSNSAGGHFFMSLYSGQRIHGYSWEQLPIDDDVIERVEQLAVNENQPKLVDGLPIFEWARNVPITDLAELEHSVPDKTGEAQRAIDEEVQIDLDENNQDVEAPHQLGVRVRVRVRVQC